MTATSEAPLPAAAPPTGTVDIPTLVARLKPVVVNVTVESTVRVPARREWDWPFDFFFGRPGNRGPRGGEEQMFQQRAMGSGFIIDGAGHVVTNAHVVEGADVVRVKLLDERELKATVKGRDRHLDIAVLEVQGAQNLPVAALGSSDALRVGESVIAIGNPFGLGFTVTIGIVSAKSRTIGAGPYDDFIQTDAHINPGNSGGPLFDLRGEVIGINTAVTSQGSGIGFAIPIDDVKGILPELIQKGHLERGRLGVVVQPIDWPLSRALGLDRPRGALVASVEPGSPAEKAKLLERDVIVAVDNKPIEHFQELPQLIARRAPGSRVELEVIRDGKPMTVDVTLARLSDDTTAENGPSGDRQKDVGVDVEDAPGGGALVRQVMPAGPASQVLAAGDVVLEVNGAPVQSAADFDRLVRAAPAKGTLLFKLRRDGQTRLAAIDLP